MARRTLALIGCALGGCVLAAAGVILIADARRQRNIRQRLARLKDCEEILATIDAEREKIDAQP